MSALDDGPDDDLRELLRGGYARDADPQFSAALLARMQAELPAGSAGCPRRRCLGWAAAAAGLALACGVAAIVFYPRDSAPRPIVQAPPGQRGPTVVRGRLLRWSAPLAEIAVCEVIHGTLQTTRLQVDLGPDADAGPRDAVPRSPTDTGAATSLGEAPPHGPTALVALLCAAAGKELVLELEAGSAAAAPPKGRILSWQGIAELPPRGEGPPEPHAGTIVVNDNAGGRWPMDEWGMPR